MDNVMMTLSKIFGHRSPCDRLARGNRYLWDRGCGDMSYDLVDFEEVRGD